MANKRQITLVGYGNQGRAWAANLRDSGWNVVVSGRLEGKGIAQAKLDGFNVVSAEDLRSISGPIALLTPDEAIPSFFRRYLEGGSGRQFLFAHGFAVTFGKLPVSASDDLVLVAPKGIGQKLRETYVAGSGVMGVLGVEQDGSGKAWEIAKDVADGLGLSRIGLIRSTFGEEAKTDLLSEQVILCGAVPKLVTQTIDFLVGKGINKELATYECLNELKLITDMMVEHGVEGMLKKVSSAAYYGGQQAAEVILPTAELEVRTEALWREIENGGFAERLGAHIAKRDLVQSLSEVQP
ncbi:MAG: ketol-acid reductoisomerase [Bacteriovoracia bacterium]